MKLRYLPILVLLTTLITSLTPLFADPDRLTSEEWFAIPASSRLEHVLIAMDRLTNEGVPLNKSADEYVSEINDLFAKKPHRSAISVSDILPSIVYAKEPKSRKIMDELIKKNKLDKIEKLE